MATACFCGTSSWRNMEIFLETRFLFFAISAPYVNEFLQAIDETPLLAGPGVKPRLAALFQQFNRQHLNLIIEAVIIFRFRSRHSFAAPQAVYPLSFAVLQQSSFVRTRPPGPPGS
jgi:hypothetical protein